MNNVPSERAFSLFSGGFGRFGNRQFAPPGDGSGGTETTPTPTPTVTPTPTPTGGSSGSGNDVDVTTLENARRALKENKSLKTKFRTLCKAIGLEFKRVKVVEGEDGNPKLAGTDGYDADAIIDAARTGVDMSLTRGNRRAKPKANEAVSVQVSELTSKVENANKRIAALKAYIKKTAVIEPLRAACIKYGAIDDDNGQFGDVVTKLAPMFVVDIDLDDDDAEAAPDVSVTCMSEGQPFIDQKTSRNYSPDGLVAWLLAKKPQYFKATSRPRGVGAGGAANHSVDSRGGGNEETVTTSGQSKLSPAQRQANSVAAMFGGAVTADSLLDDE